MLVKKRKKVSKALENVVFKLNLREATFLRRVLETSESDVQNGAIIDSKEGVDGSTYAASAGASKLMVTEVLGYSIDSET